MLKSLITAGRYEEEDMLNKLDIFLTFDRISEENYMELVGLIQNK